MIADPHSLVADRAVLLALLLLLMTAIYEALLLAQGRQPRLPTLGDLCMALGGSTLAVQYLRPDWGWGAALATALVVLGFGLRGLARHRFRRGAQRS